MPRALSTTTPRRTSKRGALPEIDAQLATLVDEPPEGDGWLHEIKFDGYRAIAYLDHGEVRLVSRNGLSFNERFAPVCTALARLPVERAIGCEDEFRELAHAFRTLIRPHIDEALAKQVMARHWLPDGMTKPPHRPDR